MKNIENLLQSIGIEIPADKKDEFKKSFNENYKTISEVEKLQSKLSTVTQANEDLQSKYDTDIKQRDTDLENLQSQLNEVANDSTKLAEVTGQLESLKADYANAKSEYEKNLTTQKYEALVREATNALKFSSNSAKKAFLADALAQNLTVKDGNLLGFNDYVNAYKETDADAFAVEEKQEDEGAHKTPSFLSKSANPKEPKDEEFERPLIL